MAWGHLVQTYCLLNALPFATKALMFCLPLNVEPRFDISTMSRFYSASFCIKVSCRQTVLGSRLPEIAKSKVNHKLLWIAIPANNFWMDMIWVCVFQGQTINDIPPEVLIDCAQLVKNNSIQGKDIHLIIFVITVGVPFMAWFHISTNEVIPALISVMLCIQE